MKKNIYDLVNSKVTHKKYGVCQVMSIIDAEQFKIEVKVLKDESVKKLLFSSNYFEEIDDFEYLILPEYVKKEKRKYQKPDMTKHRRHPLVKAIDAMEQRLKVPSNSPDEQDDTPDDEE